MTANSPFVDDIKFPTADDLAEWEKIDPADRPYQPYHAEPTPRILVPLDVEDLDLISSTLRSAGVLGIADHIDAHWVALTVAIDRAQS